MAKNQPFKLEATYAPAPNRAGSRSQTKKANASAPADRSLYKI